ncbi:Oxa1Ec [Chromobacterium violaceum]|uniref:Membrane protein insertase YidC n=1 Tax=Chromobacterium violaceum TaxID=536 RepID=A0A447TLY8_CHRVL|nr:Oxa1Ec [Chromobacterium violaceum]
MAQPADANKLTRGQRIQVKTDLVEAEIDTVGGDLRSLKLLKHGAAEDHKQPFQLFEDSAKRVYVAQTGLVAASNPALPTHKTVFASDKPSYQLTGDTLEVKLTAPDANGVKVSKVYTFKKNSYEIGVRYDIVNGGAAPLAPPPTTACCATARRRKAKAAWPTPTPARPCTPRNTSSRR